LYRKKRQSACTRKETYGKSKETAEACGEKNYWKRGKDGQPNPKGGTMLTPERGKCGETSEANTTEGKKVGMGTKGGRSRENEGPY